MDVQCILNTVYGICKHSLLGYIHFLYIKIDFLEMYYHLLNYMFAAELVHFDYTHDYTHESKYYLFFIKGSITTVVFSYSRQY